MAFTRHRSSDGFRCTVEAHDDHAVVRPIGEVDLATVGRVDESLRELWRTGFRDLRVDLRRVTFLDSTGIALMVRWERRAAQDGIAFAVILGDARVTRPLELTGVLGFLTVRDA